MISRCHKWPDLGGGCEPRSGHLRQCYITLYEAPASFRLLFLRIPKKSECTPVLMITYRNLNVLSTSAPKMCLRVRFTWTRSTWEAPRPPRTSSDRPPGWPPPQTPQQRARAPTSTRGSRMRAIRPDTVETELSAARCSNSSNLSEIRLTFR